MPWSFRLWGISPITSRPNRSLTEVALDGRGRSACAPTAANTAAIRPRTPDPSRITARCLLDTDAGAVAGLIVSASTACERGWAVISRAAALAAGWVTAELVLVA